MRQVEAELAQAGADHVTEELATDIANELKSGHSVAYTALATEDAVIVARATDAPSADKPAEATKPAEPAPSSSTTTTPTTPAS